MRHGEVDYFDAQGRPQRPQTVPLSGTGQEQARAAGRALADIRIDRVISSGLPRARQTLELAVQGRPLPLEEDARWREIETGPLREWAAVTPQEVERTILGSLPPELRPDDRFLAGETYSSLAERVHMAWNELLARSDWQVVLIVAHGIVNRFLLSHLLGAGLAGVGALEQDAGCVNLIEVDPAGRHLVRLINATPGDLLKVHLSHSTVEGLYLQFLRGRG
jgi:probable phosphoglycerate mutase